jgi:hypothetical protein
MRPWEDPTAREKQKLEAKGFLFLLFKACMDEMEIAALWRPVD